MGGFFKVYRDIFHHEIFKHELDFRLFMLILGNAMYDKNGATIEGIHVKRGQWIRSYRNLMKDLEYKQNRGYRQYGIATIKRAISRLIKNELITISETECGTLFTVINYEKYQGISVMEEQNAEQNSEQLRNNYGTTSEQKKESKKDKKLSDNNNPADEPFPDPFEIELTEEQKLENEIEDYYQSKRGKYGFPVSPKDRDLIKKAIYEEKFTREEIISGINEAVLIKGPDGINSFAYCLKVMRTQKEEKEKAAKRRVVPFERRKQAKPDKLPEMIRLQMEQQDQPPQPITPEQLERQKAIREKIKQMSQRAKAREAQP